MYIYIYIYMYMYICIKQCYSNICVMIYTLNLTPGIRRGGVRGCAGRGQGRRSETERAPKFYTDAHV